MIREYRVFHLIIKDRIGKQTLKMTLILRQTEIEMWDTFFGTERVTVDNK